MNKLRKSRRKHVAQRARQYLSNAISWKELINDLYQATEEDEDDELLADLYDLIEHEPQRGGFLGLSEEKWQQYQSEISRVLKNLEQDVSAT